MRDEHLFVICYDISEARARRRVADLLERHGTRVQESVFEVRTTARLAELLLEHAGRHCLPGDGLRMYCLTEAGRQLSRAFGRPTHSGANGVLAAVTDEKTDHGAIGARLRANLEPVDLPGLIEGWFEHRVQWRLESMGRLAADPGLIGRVRGTFGTALLAGASPEVVAGTPCP